MIRCLQFQAVGVCLICSLVAHAPSAYAAPQAPVAAKHGMVVTAQHLATQVGVDILQ